MSFFPKKKKKYLSEFLDAKPNHILYKKISKSLKSGFLGVVLVKRACVRPFSVLKSEKSIFTNSEQNQNSLAQFMLAQFMGRHCT